MSPIDRLRGNGYSDNDIMDLIHMFEKQIIHLKANIDNLNTKDTAEELHRLKGGCDLLYLYDFTDKVAEIRTFISTADISTSKSLLNDLINELIVVFTRMKQQLTTN